MTDASQRLIENLERQNADCQAESEHRAHDIGGEVACYQCALNVAAMQRITELEAENARLREAVTVLTRGMDRAGGDAQGMPECPWCKRGPDGEDHKGDCELAHARELLDALRGQR